MNNASEQRKSSSNTILDTFCIFNAVLTLPIFFLMIETAIGVDDITTADLVGLAVLPLWLLSLIPAAMGIIVGIRSTSNSTVANAKAQKVRYFMIAALDVVLILTFVISSSI